MTLTLVTEAASKAGALTHPLFYNWLLKSLTLVPPDWSMTYAEPMPRWITVGFSVMILIMLAVVTAIVVGDFFEQEVIVDTSRWQ